MACGAVVWRMHGALRVTVILKIGFALVHEGAARPTAPTDLVRIDRRPQGGASVDEVPDLAPYLPSAGVLLSGHACAPTGGAAASTAVRLILFRGDQTALDKTLHIFGDRDATPAAPADQQINFLTGDEWIVLDGMHRVGRRAAAGSAPRGGRGRGRGAGRAGAGRRGAAVGASSQGAGAPRGRRELR